MSGPIALLPVDFDASNFCSGCGSPMARLGEFIILPARGLPGYLSMGETVPVERQKRCSNWGRPLAPHETEHDWFQLASYEVIT